MAKKQNPIWGWHKKVLEQNSLVLTVGVLAVVSIGGLVEIAPLFYLDESIMPPYAFLETTRLETEVVEGRLRALRRLGVPYTDEMIENAEADLEAQLDPFSASYDAFVARYPGAPIRDFDGNPEMISELDALIAYLQVLGTMVDFSTYEADADENLR